MLEGERHSAGGVFAPLMRRLEAEQERWFLWMPVLLGLGIGFYFSLPAEPHILDGARPARRDARAHCRRAPAHGRDAGADRVDRGGGGVRSRQAARRVGARAGSGQADVVSRGARLRGARRAQSQARPARHAAGDVDGQSAAGGMAVPRARLDRQVDAGPAGRQRRAPARDPHAAGRAGAARRLRLRAPGLVRAARRARIYLYRG